MGVVSCGIGGLVVAHVGRRLLLGRSPRQSIVHVCGVGTKWMIGSVLICNWIKIGVYTEWTQEIDRTSKRESV